MTRIRTPLLLWTLTAAVLASCTSTPPAGPTAAGPEQPVGLPNPAVDHPGQVAPRYDFVATVPVKGGDTITSLQAASGGTVISWSGAGCAAGCEAQLGLNVTQGQAAPSESDLSTKLSRAVTVDANRGQFGAGGAITAVMGGTKIAWAGGSLLAWSGGTKIAWAGGSYTPVPQNTQTWNAIHLEQAQALAPNLGAGVVVAVIDTGLDLNHVAFQGSLTDPGTWWDYYGGDAVPQDEGTLGTGGFGHGTNVAGIILQVAPKARIMPLRVLGPDGSGDVANVVSAIRWAVDHGAHVINLSLGSSSSVKGIETALVAAALKNVQVVTSAGNNHSSALTYPAQTAQDIPNLLSVASVDVLGAKSSFSNYGHATEVVAPGENVFAPAPGNMLASWSGTSQAAPMVSGGLALALGQTLKVPAAALPGAVSHSASNRIYDLSANWGYGGQLGSGELNLSALLTQTLK